MDDPVTELAAYFQRRIRVPDEDLVRLTSAVRAAGRSWGAIAAACGVRAYEDTIGIVGQPGGIRAATAAGLIYLATQNSVQELTGSRRYPPLTWSCPGCRQLVTDRAPTGRPAHVEHGHASGCARLARDQGADAAERRSRLPRLVDCSEPEVGRLQRHRLTEPLVDDDCPRCGWHGYFHDHVSTSDGDWSAVVCDNCYSDLAPGVAVAVRFFSARSWRGEEPFAVIRQRERSDRTFADPGEMMTWRLCWESTSLLAERERGSCGEDITEISRRDAEKIMAGLSARYWPPEAAGLAWVRSAYPG